MKSENKSNYKGKYYDPNYHQNKRKYGDAYDPQKFAVRNPNWEPQRNNRKQSNKSQSKRKSNYKGRNYDPNWHNYSYEQREAIRRRRAQKQIAYIIGFALVYLIIYMVSETTLLEGGLNKLFTDTPTSYTSPDEPQGNLTADLDQETENVEVAEVGPDIDSLSGNTVYSVDACDLSGSRKPNAKVDVGYGERQYYGYTNEYSQLVYGYASSLKLQNSRTENVTDSGRYCSDEANVPGTESSSLDQGHVFGDALGGVANAYNITPQNSYVNQTQINELEREMQDTLYNGGSVTNFETKIYYPNSTTQTPVRYELSYNINGESRTYSFNN